MKLICCVDQKNGMMFFGKRQSQDKVLRQEILNMTVGHPLWMSVYSAKQFEQNDSIVVDDHYASKAGAEDYCFVEDRPLQVEGVSEIILCHWNRQYPADRFFDIDLKAAGFHKASAKDISGSSHETITLETYRKEGFR